MTHSETIRKVTVDDYDRNCERRCYHGITLKLDDNTPRFLAFSGKYIAKNYYSYLSDKQKGHFEKYRGVVRTESNNYRSLLSAVEIGEEKNYLQAMKLMEVAVNRLEKYKDSILLPEYATLYDRYPYQKCWQTGNKIEAIDFLVEKLRLVQKEFLTINHPQKNDFDIYCISVHDALNDYREPIEENRYDWLSSKFMLNFCLTLTGVGAVLIAVSFLIFLPIELYQSRQHQRAFDARYCFFGGQSTTRNILREIESALVIVKKGWEKPSAVEEENERFFSKNH